MMGSGIAQVAAAAGFETVVREVSAELVDKGIKSIEKNLNRLAEKGCLRRWMRFVNHRRSSQATHLP